VIIFFIYSLLGETFELQKMGKKKSFSGLLKNGLKPQGPRNFT